MQTGWTAERQTFADICRKNLRAQRLARLLGAKNSNHEVLGATGGEVAYEVMKLLDITVSTEEALTIAFRCFELSKKVFEHIDGEIPF